MAHQRNVTSIGRDFFDPQQEEQVKDPTCGKTLKRKDSRHILFRGDTTYYFCSTECKEGFIHPKAKKAS